MFAPLRKVECIGDDDRSERSDMDDLIDAAIFNYFDSIPDDEEAIERLRNHVLTFGM